MFRRVAVVVAGGVPLLGLGAAGVYRYNNRPQVPQHVLSDLHGQVAVVTGGTSGIGRETARGLVGLGAHVIIGARDPVKGEVVRQELLEAATPGAQVEVQQLDMSSPASVRDFCNKVMESHSAVDVLVSSAAEIHTQQGMTADDVDVTFATNHVGVQALVMGLERVLEQAHTRGGVGTRKQDHRARVVLVSSKLEAKADLDLDTLQTTKGATILVTPTANTAQGSVMSDGTLDKSETPKSAEGIGGGREFNPLMHYAATKKANMLLALHLHNMWSSSQSCIDVLTVTPGMVHTSIFKHYPDWYRAVTFPLRALALRSPREAAAGVLYAAAAEEASGRSGEYLRDGLTVAPSDGACDSEAASALFGICQDFIRECTLIEDEASKDEVPPRASRWNTFLSWISLRNK